MDKGQEEGLSDGGFFLFMTPPISAMRVPVSILNFVQKR